MAETSTGSGPEARETQGFESILVNLPKIELHLHLDCSLSYDVVHRLDSRVTLEDYRRDFIAPNKCRNLAEFLERPPRQIALMQTEQQIRLVVLDVFSQLQRDGVIYAELRFAPLLHTAGGLSTEHVVATVDAAAAEGARLTGIETRVILCALRHFTADESLATAELVARFAGTAGCRVAALDLAGDEAGFPLEPHIAAFDLIARRGIARTAHAGEGLGAASVRETLERLSPSRIGHGVRAAEDPSVVEMLASSRIHLEVCPSSNVQTNVCETLADHPIGRLAGAGVALGISTDTRTVTDTTLVTEYRRLVETFGWTRSDFLRCNRQALEAAFAPEELKARLQPRLDRGYLTVPTAN